MSIREQIETKQASLRELCHRVGVAALQVVIEGESWSDVTFVGDIDITRLKGYAARFFDLEEGLVRIFDRPVHLVDREGFEAVAKREPYRKRDVVEQIELLHAS